LRHAIGGYETRLGASVILGRWALGLGKEVVTLKGGSLATGFACTSDILLNLISMSTINMTRVNVAFFISYSLRILIPLNRPDGLSVPVVCLATGRWVGRGNGVSVKKIMGLLLWVS